MFPRIPSDVASELHVLSISASYLMPIYLILLSDPLIDPFLLLFFPPFPLLTSHHGTLQD